MQFSIVQDEIRHMHLKRTRQIIGLLAFIIMLAACNDSVSVVKNACPESAQQYWKKFRSAVLKNKLNEIADMTHFPLEIRGMLDDSEKKIVSRQGFSKHFPQLLNTELGDYYQQPVITPAPSSMKALVSATTKLSPSFCSADSGQFRVGEWVFLLKPNGWGFVQAFVNES